MVSSDILDLICDLVKNDIQGELGKIRRSRAFDGQLKPIGTGGAGYIGALSQRITTGKLYESVTVRPVETENGFDIEVSFPGADYWRWVNYGRRGRNDEIAGNSPTVKYPPLYAIQNWIAEKGLPQFRDKRGRFLSNKTRAFLVQRSIGEYGIFPTLFIQEGIKKSEERVNYYLGDYGRELLTTIINNNLGLNPQ